MSARIAASPGIEGASPRADAGPAAGRRPGRRWLTQLEAGLDRGSLEARLGAVLDFALGHLAELDRYAEHWTDELDPYVSLADKVVVESALLALVASRVGGADDGPLAARIDRLAACLVPHARSQRNRVLLMRFPHTAGSLGIAHAALDRAGYPDPELDHLMRGALASGQVEAVERLPFRAMEVRWLRGLLDPGSEQGFGDLLSASVLCSTAHPIHMSAAEVYALTHALMYVTDFGLRSLPDTVDARRAARLVDAAVAWTLVTENLDLLGELVMAAALLDLPWSPAVRFGWHALTRFWDELGFLPCPSFEVRAFSALEGDAARAYAFRHVYHTTYVGGMLCAVLMARGQTAVTAAGADPRETEARARSARGLSAVATAALRFRRTAGPAAASPTAPGGADGQTAPPPSAGDDDLATVDGLVRALVHRRDRANPPAWTDTLAGAPLAAGELERLLLDAVLIEACRSYDLGLLAAALSAAAHRIEEPSPTACAAASFLARQQLVDGALGAAFLVEANRRGPAAEAVTRALAVPLAELAARLL